MRRDLARSSNGRTPGRGALPLASLVLGAALASSFAPLTPANAAPARPAPAKAPVKPAPAKAPAKAAPAKAPASALVRVATEIAGGLGAVPPGALVAASPLGSDVAAPRGDELASRVAAHVAGRLGHAHAHPQPATLASALRVAGRAASLVYIEVRVDNGELRATADLYPVVSNAWERLRNPAPGPRAHVFVAAPIDAEVRTFLKPIVLEEAKVLKALHEETEVLAVGCGDVEADGGLELVLSTRSDVSLAKLRDGRVSTVRSTPWAALAPRAPIPMREPLASVAFPLRPGGELLLGSTDRGSVAVDASLVRRRELEGLPVPGAGGEVCASPIAEHGAFGAELIACAPRSKGGAAAGVVLPVPRADAVAMLDLVGKDGSVTRFVAAREPGGRLHLQKTNARGEGDDAIIDAAGAQIALADLDLDGSPEVVFSLNTPDEDALTIASWTPGGLVERMKIPAKEGVRALAACPPEARGAPGLVAVVGSEVWLVR